ncbi:TonB family protein [Lysobacter sp. MMG2]|uniref:energy transducer TonB n=1 Tax=Lysobacter sp. MMG2 TaxID=2801338 RepID=UPI001C23658C|nr:energy transducer TonB [Lysobacter sp. MMG2]MBU8975066.1 TonB family protein [Lysobacter sp. MMG2]
MAHAIHFPSGTTRDPIDGGRIAANTGTLLINGAVVLALLVPLSQQIVQAPVQRDDAIQIVQLEKPKPIVPLPPDPVEIVRKPPPPTSQPVRTPQPVARVEQQVVDSQPGDVAITAPDVAIDTTPSLEPVAPPAAAQLQALVSPPPPYPGDAMRAGLSGTVELEILVGADGQPLDVRVVRSSGHRVLDQAARRTVLSKWRFQPATRDGRAVEALGRVPIEFKL